MPIRAAVAASLLLAVALPAAAQTIDTRNGPIVSGFAFGTVTPPSSFAPFQQIGETFVAPAGAAALTSFSFFLSKAQSSGVSTFVARIQAWDGSAPTGAVLFSAAGSFDAATAPSSYVEQSFATGGLAVTPGASYVAYLVSTNAEPDRVAWVGTALGNSYAAGAAYLAPSASTTTDVAFVARFAQSTVPEPSAVALLGGGLLALGALGRRARRNG